MYIYTHYTGVSDQLCPVDFNLLQNIQADVCEVPPMCSSSFKALADQLVQELHLPLPALNVHQACQSYFAIVHFLNSIA